MEWKHEILYWKLLKDHGMAKCAGIKGARLETDGVRGGNKSALGRDAEMKLGAVCQYET